MKTPLSAVSTVVEMLLRSEAYKATKYLSEKQVVRATRRLYDRKISKKGNVEIMLTLGRPNYEEREFIKLCKKARVPFPVKQIQIKFPPKRNPKRKNKKNARKRFKE